MKVECSVMVASNKNPATQRWGWNLLKIMYRRWFGPGSMSSKQVARRAKLASNPFAQPDVRMREMQRLLRDGGEDALKGLLRRFAHNAQGQIADEEEKKWLEDALVDQGEISLAPLRHYIATEQKLTYALRAFERIVGRTIAIAYFTQVLEQYGPEDYRSSEAKLQLIGQLADGSLSLEHLLPLLPFLEDHSDDVRWALLAQMEKYGHPSQGMALAQHVLPVLAKVLASEQTSPRIMLRIADVLCQLNWKWPVAERRLPALLEEQFHLDKQGHVRRKKRT